MLWEKEREKDQAAGVEEEKLGEEELWDHMKRVKGDELVSLYAALQDDVDMWYDIWVPEDGELPASKLRGLTNYCTPE